MKKNIVFPHLPIGAGGSRVCRASWSSRDALSGFITRETLFLILLKWKIIFPWRKHCIFSPPYRGRRVQSVSGILIPQETLCLVLSLERHFVWFHLSVKPYFHENEHCISSPPYWGRRVQSVSGLLISREKLCLILSLERHFVWFYHSRDALYDLMKLSNHISIKVNIVFLHAPIGVGGSRVCWASWSFERRFVWFYHQIDVVMSSVQVRKAIPLC